MSGNSPLVYAVVITYNGREFLEGCLSTLLGTDYDNLRVLLVLNGCSDGSEEFVQQAFPSVELLALPSNIGCLPACNQGMETALARAADYVVLCNDDIEALDDRWLHEAIDAMDQQPDAGVVGFEESTTRDLTLPNSIHAIPTERVIAFAFLLRATMLKSLGLFDLDFAVFAAEDDLLLRAKRAGYGARQLNIPFLHVGGGTVTRSDPQTGYMQMRSALRLCLKHRGLLRTAGKVLRILDVACNPWPLSANPNDNAHRRMRNRGNLLVNAWMLLRAISWNALHLQKTLGSRRRDVDRANLAFSAQSATAARLRVRPAQSRKTERPTQPLSASANTDIVAAER